jgi:UDP-N-acetylmuramyl pentapeptide synthase
MLELGECAIELHKEVGKHAALCCDEIFCYGDLGRHIADGATEAGHKKVHFFEFSDREAFILAIKEAAVDCSMLFKASNRMRFPEIIENVGL